MSVSIAPCSVVHRPHSYTPPSPTKTNAVPQGAALHSPLPHKNKCSVAGPSPTLTPLPLPLPPRTTATRPQRPSSPPSPTHKAHLQRQNWLSLLLPDHSGAETVEAGPTRSRRTQRTRPRGGSSISGQATHPTCTGGGRREEGGKGQAADQTHRRLLHVGPGNTPHLHRGGGREEGGKGQAADQTHRRLLHVGPGNTPHLHRR